MLSDIRTRDQSSYPTTIPLKRSSRFTIPHQVKLGEEIRDTLIHGNKCLDLFDWIIEKATDPPGGSGTSLKVVIEYLNDRWALYRRNLKDELDEVVLKGMSRAGHLSHESKTKLPAYLRESGYGLSSRIEKPGRVKTHKSKVSSEIRMQDKHNLHASKSIERGINSDRIADTPPNSGESRTLIGSIPSAADVQREQHIAYSRHPYHQQPNAHVDDTRNLYAPQQFLYGVIPSAGNFPHHYHYRHYPYTESVDATPYIHGSFPPSSVILPTTSNTRISQHPVIPYSRYPQHPLSQLHPFEDYPRPRLCNIPLPTLTSDQRTLDPIPNAAHRRRLSESELPDPKRLRKKPPESE
ncbi:hypothetical protein BC829DRAFT_395465 [Chytridium lagenaria]|nr:hypothetical protein BC829DRAFT_395465 [Chytridium lagenaria]